MANPWKKLKGLLPEAPLLVGAVTAIHPDGTTTVQTLGGGILRVRGQGVSIGSKAFVRGGVLEGPAPNLPSYTVAI